MLAVLALLLCFTPAVAQQVGDSLYVPSVTDPAYEPGTGPLVLVDEAHDNFHRAGGRYLAFARILEADGYVVEPSHARFTPQTLAGAGLLVVANALAPRNVEDWSLPTPPAFTESEVEAVKTWVGEGGSLLVIADHMPFPGAVENLAGAFGVVFSNGFVFQEGESQIRFRRSDGSLAEHAITRGESASAAVDSVTSFTGSAFHGQSLEPLLILRDGCVSLEPEEAWKFSKDTRRVPVDGWYQGAVMRHGKGRVAFFGEAAMFTSQRSGPNARPMGMSAPGIGQNERFLRNLVGWLTREGEE